MNSRIKKVFRVTIMIAIALIIIAIAAAFIYSMIEVRDTADITEEINLNMTFEGSKKLNGILMERWHDNELNVTCYVYACYSTYGKGVSCIPDKDIGR